MLAPAGMEAPQKYALLVCPDRPVAHRLALNVQGLVVEQLVGEAWQFSGVSKHSKPAEFGDAPAGSSGSHTHDAPLPAAGPAAQRNDFSVHLGPPGPAAEHRFGADSHASWVLKHGKPDVVVSISAGKVTGQLYAAKALELVSAPEKHSFGVSSHGTLMLQAFGPETQSKKLS